MGCFVAPGCENKRTRLKTFAPCPRGRAMIEILRTRSGVRRTTSVPRPIGVCTAFQQVRGRIPIVHEPHVTVQPGAVVVVLGHADPADPAMLAPCWLREQTRGARSLEGSVGVCLCVCMCSDVYHRTCGCPPVLASSTSVKMQCNRNRIK